MKKKISLIIALALMLSAFCVTGASAAESTELSVRVNGYIVEFPDAQPFVDSNNRTMIPVRFATKQLGADVSWNNETKTATIEKDGISVAISIGDADLKVTQNGETTTVTMDTAAIIRESRTYVPIRFVAEALGAYVDYSDVYRVVGIYSDVLTTEQIATLRTYDYTQSKAAVSYETAKGKKTAEELEYFYGADRESFNGEFGYANAREHLYNFSTRAAKYPFASLDIVLNDSTTDEFFDLLVREAKAEVAYVSDNISFKFITDTSCIYQEDNYSGITTTVRGIVAMTCYITPTELTGEEMATANKYGFTQILKGETVYIAVDIHMNAQADYYVNIKTIVPLGSQYK